MKKVILGLILAILNFDIQSQESSIFSQEEIQVLRKLNYEREIKEELKISGKVISSDNCAAAAERGKELKRGGFSLSRLSYILYAHRNNMLYFFPNIGVCFKIE